MRCRTCDYALWNLKARVCPECGAPFRPSDYDFVVESVEFCCPHCEQGYFGTGHRGHLAPAEFDCVNCGRHVAMDEMLLRPAFGVSEARTQPDEVPWLNRKTNGWWKSWIYTVGMSMGQPFRLMRATPPADGTEQAWRFALVTAFLIALFGYAVPFGGIAVVAAAGSGSGPGLGTAAGALVCLVAVPLVQLLFILIWGAVTHGILALTGGTNEGIGRTFQAICYSSGVNAPTVVPCLGPYCLSQMTAVWWVISAILMVKQAHRIGGGRATLATIAAPVVVTILLMLMYFAFLIIPFGLAGMAGPGGAAMTPLSQSQLLTQAVQSYAYANGNTGPGHAAVLIGDNLASPWDFISGASGTDAATIRLTDSYTLDDLQFADFESQQAIGAQLANRLPENVTAHRLGDYVFTYHGMDFGTDDPGLWIMIEAPLSGTGTSGAIWVGHLDGTVTTLRVVDFRNELRLENQRRAAAGLPPLVDPLRITHTGPEVARDED